MTWFPQIGAGSIAQFPLRRTRKWRSIVNELEGGELIRLADSAAGLIDWCLVVQELTDAEAGTLNNFFAASQGEFGSFLFIDPMANLLAWSEELARPDWQPGLLQITAGATDPSGSQRASVIHNPSAGQQSLQQTLGVPGDYVACFSAWIRSTTAGAVLLARDSRSVACEIGPGWKRFFVGGAGTSSALQSTFSLSLAAGQSIDIWGLQAEAQPYASQYKQSAAALGIYEETWFAADKLKVTSTGVGRSSCEIVLTSRVR
jgi:hypothetical protein